MSVKRKLVEVFFFLSGFFCGKEFFVLLFVCCCEKNSPRFCFLDKSKFLPQKAFTLFTRPDVNEETIKNVFFFLARFTARGFAKCESVDECYAYYQRWNHDGDVHEKTFRGFVGEKMREHVDDDTQIFHVSSSFLFPSSSSPFSQTTTWSVSSQNDVFNE